MIDDATPETPETAVETPAAVRSEPAPSEIYTLSAASEAHNPFAESEAIRSLLSEIEAELKKLESEPVALWAKFKALRAKF